MVDLSHLRMTNRFRCVLSNERLPNLCYWCGRLTNANKECELWIESEGTLRPEQRQFGPSIRALVFVPSRKNVISVPGFYKAMKKTSHEKATTSMDCDNSGQSMVVHDEAEATVDQTRVEESEPLGVDNPNLAHNVRPNVTDPNPLHFYLKWRVSS